jgi:hypothetical protein
MRNVLLALALLVAVPATLQAGNGNGGGSKPTVTLRVTNNAQGQTLIVIVDRPSNVSLNSSREDFEHAGGKVLAWRESATFKVRAGAHTVEAAFLNPDFTPGTVASASVNVQRNEHRTISATGNPTNPSLSVSSR